MATNYPNSLDSLTNPATTDPVNSPSHAIQHANANDAIEALQFKVGVDNSLTPSSLDYRVRQLESNPTGTANKITQQVINNTGVTLPKGSAVYITGAVGASGQLRAALASNNAEPTSSKTFGILAESVIQGGVGTVVTEGLLQSVNTVGANDGDPIWLGTSGNLIFGLTNKPVAPAHLVFLGIVVRGGHATTGEIFVKVQNGFEIDELHDVLITAKADLDLISYDASAGIWKNNSLNTLGIATQSYVNQAVTSLSNTSASTYALQADVGNPDGIATLDSTGNVPLSQLGNLVAGAPTALDTLNELAAALGDNPNYATDITTALGNKQNKVTGVSDIEIGYLDGVTSPLQTQLDSKITASSVDIFTNKTIGGTGLAFNDGSNSSSIYPYGNDLNLAGNYNLYLNTTGGDIIMQPHGSAKIYDDIIVTKNASQTLANKTLNYPVLNSPTGLVKADVGLNNVDNTSDLNKPISYAVQTELNNYALLHDPTFTGVPAAPTAASGTNTTQIATTAFVKSAIDTSVQPGSLYQTSAPTNPAVGQIWVDADDEVTVFDSNIIRRKTFTATASQTTFTTDVPFVQGYEQVFMNGILLIRTIDYTTPSTTSVLLASGAAAGDIIDVIAITNLNSVDTYTQAETNALLAGVQTWTPSSISANTNLAAKGRYFVTSASALTLTLPANPAVNDEIQILDASGNASTYNITVARNGKLINGGTGNLIIDTNGGWYGLIYTGSTYGWKVG